MYRLYIRNVKIIGTADIDLRGLTIIAGSRGAGKSTVLESLKFLYNAKNYDNVMECTPNPQDPRLENCYETLSVPGYYPYPWDIVNVYELAARSEHGGKVEALTYLHDLRNQRGWGVSISVESGTYKYSLAVPSKEVISRELGLEESFEVSPDAIPRVHVVSALRANPARIERSVDDETLRSEGVGVRGEYVNEILRLIYYAYPPVSARLISRIAQEYKSLIENKYKKYAEKYSIDERVVVDAKPCYQDDICVIEKAFGSIYPDGEGGEAVFPLSLLSFGSRNLAAMLLELSIVRAILSENKDEKIILGIEEPEITLHPSSLMTLTELILDTVKEFKERLYIVATTHSIVPIFILSKYLATYSEESELIDIYLMIRRGEFIETHKVSEEAKVTLRKDNLIWLGYASLYELELLEKLSDQYLEI